MFAPLLLAVLFAAGPEGPPGEVLSEVAGEQITRGRVNLLLELRAVPEAKQAEIWDETIAEMTDRALMRRFLSGRRATPDEGELDAQVAVLLKNFGEDEAAQTAALAELGVTPEDVRTEAALPRAWEVQASRVITPQSLERHFEANRRRFDGTALTVAQVFQPGDATEELAALKRRIDAGELTFAAAAKQYSQAPSADEGGVIGTPVRYGDGRVPPEVAAAAFALKEGEVSAPVRSAFGTHLVTVLGVAEPGDLALEDRGVLLPVRRDLKAKLWAEQLERLK